MHKMRQVVEEAFVRWSAGQGSILDLMEDDGIVLIPGIAPHCGSRSKKEFVAEVATPFMSRFSNPPAPRPSMIVGEGNHVIVLADADGTTLDGHIYRNSYVFVLEFREETLVKATEFLDMAAFNLVWDSITPAIQTTDSVEQPR